MFQMKWRGHQPLKGAASTCGATMKRRKWRITLWDEVHESPDTNWTHATSQCFTTASSPSEFRNIHFMFFTLLNHRLRSDNTAYRCVAYAQKWWEWLWISFTCGCFPVLLKLFSRRWMICRRWDADWEAETLENRWKQTVHIYISSVAMHLIMQFWRLCWWVLHVALMKSNKL